MSLLLMKNNPLRRAIAIYDPYGGSGQILYDKSGHGNNAQLGSTSGSDTNDPTLSYNSALFGVDDFLKFTSSDILNAQDMTIILCGSQTSTTATTRHLFSTINASGNNTGYWLTTYSTNIYFSKSNGDGTQSNNISYYTAISQGVPFCIGFRKNSVNAVINVGSQKGSTQTFATPEILSSSSAIGGFIGNRNSANASIEGNIYFVAFFNRALSDAEYTRAYNYIKSLLAGRGITV